MDSFGTYCQGCTQESMSHPQWCLYKATLVKSEDTWGCPDTPVCSTVDYHSAESVNNIKRGCVNKIKSRGVNDITKGCVNKSMWKK